MTHVLAFGRSCVATGVALAAFWLSALPVHSGGNGASEEAQDGAPAMTGETFDGVYLGAGAECPQFMLDSGEQVSLESADMSGFSPGTRLRVTGDVARMSRCMQGRAIVVEDVRPVPPP
ncbi:MAG: hypothetical protein JJT81_07500 [Rubellimicrobium sp.]|nr:hypothetical protein [Rubellimicrobium sp.]